MQRDKFTCQHCGSSDKELHIHHLVYNKDCKPWEYNNDALITLCSRCHTVETEYNSILYSTFCDLKTLAGQRGLSKHFLDSLLNDIYVFLEIGDAKSDDADPNMSELLFNTACGSQLHSDAIALGKMGINMTDYFLNVKTKSPINNETR